MQAQISLLLTAVLWIAVTPFPALAADKVVDETGYSPFETLDWKEEKAGFIRAHDRAASALTSPVLPGNSGSVAFDIRLESFQRYTSFMVGLVNRREGAYLYALVSFTDSPRNYVIQLFARKRKDQKFWDVGEGLSLPSGSQLRLVLSYRSEEPEIKLDVYSDGELVASTGPIDRWDKSPVFPAFGNFARLWVEVSGTEEDGPQDIHPLGDALSLSLVPASGVNRQSQLELESISFKP